MNQQCCGNCNTRVDRCPNPNCLTPFPKASTFLDQGDAMQLVQKLSEASLAIKAKSEQHNALLSSLAQVTRERDHGSQEYDSICRVAGERLAKVDQLNAKVAHLQGTIQERDGEINLLRGVIDQRERPVSYKGQVRAGMDECSTVDTPTRRSLRNQVIMTVAAAVIGVAASVVGVTMIRRYMAQQETAPAPTVIETVKISNPVAGNF